MHEQARPRFRGFISYSKHDEHHAVRLRDWLEEYRVPRGVVAQLDPRRRLGRFFRDNDEIPATPDLAAEVKRQLADSDNLIVICSPNVLQSQWVNPEIEYFQRLGRGDRIFPFIVAGVPNSSSPDTECLPAALRGSTPPVPMVTKQPGTPSLLRESWESACVRLVAGLLNLGFEELWQRTRRRRRWKLTAIGSGAIAATAAFATLITIGGINRSDAAIRQARLLAREAEIASAGEDHLKALLLAVAGHRVASHSGFGPFREAEELSEISAAIEHAYTHNRQTQIIQESEPLRHVALSPDGKELITTVGGDLKRWQVGEPKPRQTIASGHKQITSVTFAPDGQMIATAAHGSVTVWSGATSLHPDWASPFGAEARLEFRAFENTATTVQFSPDGSYLLAFSDRDAAIWNARNGQLVGTTANSGRIGGAVFSRDGTKVLFRLSGGTAVLWNFETNTSQEGIAAKTSGLGTSALSHEGQILTTDRSTVSRWKLDGKSPEQTIDTRAGTVTAVAFAPSGRSYVTGSVNGTVQIWRAGRDTPIDRYVGHTSRIETVAFSEDGSMLIATSSDGTARLWQTSATPPKRIIESGGGRVLSVAISPDGERALLGTLGGSVLMWSLTEGAPIGRVQMPSFADQLPDISDLPKELRAMPLNELLDLGHREMKDPQFSREITDLINQLPAGITVEQLREMGRDLSPRMKQPEVTIVTYSPDGKRFLTGSWDQIARLWPAEGGAPLASFSVGDGLFTSARFSPDGKSVLTTVTSVGKTAIAHLRDLEGRSLATYVGHGKSITSSDISQDGRWVATGSGDQTARLWSINGGEALQVFAGPKDAVGAVRLSADASRLIAGCDDGSVWLWRIGESAASQVWQAHSSDVNSIEFLPGGDLFVTSSMDGTAKIWRIGTQAPVQTLDNYSATYQAVVSPTAKHILTALADETAALWAIDPIVVAPIEEKIRLACDRLKTIGAARFTMADLQRWSVLNGVPDDPCDAQ